jgi:hypothetical protein
VSTTDWAIKDTPMGEQAKFANIDGYIESVPRDTLKFLKEFGGW